MYMCAVCVYVRCVCICVLCISAYGMRDQGRYLPSRVVDAFTKRSWVLNRNRAKTKVDGDIDRSWSGGWIGFWRDG